MTTEQLRELLIKNKINNAEFGRIFGISKSTVSAWSRENPRNKMGKGWSLIFDHYFEIRDIPTINES